MKMSTQILRLFREDFTNEMKKLEEKYHITIKLETFDILRKILLLN